MSAQPLDDRRRALEHAIASILVSGRPASESMTEALRAITEGLGWDFAALFTWDPGERVLRCTSTWSARAFGSFDAHTRSHTITAGEELVGEALASGQPAWIADLAEAPPSPHTSEALRAGLHGALAVPIRVGGGVEAAIEVLDARARDEDPELLAAVKTVAAQLGRALCQERMLTELRESEARTAAVLEAALEAVITVDHRGRIMELNPAAERMFGYTRDEVIGREMPELLVPPSLRDTHRRSLARYLATGEAPFPQRRVELPAMRKDGSEFPAEVALARVDRSGPPVLTIFVRDVTEQVSLFRAVQVAEARQRLLAEVGAALVESLDHAAVLPRIAVLLTSELADWCAIHLTRERGLEQVAAAHRLPSKAPLIEELWRRRPPSIERELGPARVAQTGTTELIARVTDADLDRIARDAREASLLEELGFGSYLAVPLVARGNTLGALSLVLEPGGRSFDRDDVELCTEIARRCAIAVDNAQLYREAQESLRARDDFLAIAAHELQTPITPLCIRAQQLTRLVEESEGGTVSTHQLADLARAIERSSLRLAELVERLLDVSRVTVGRMALERTSFDLVALAREVVETMRSDLSRCGSDIVWDAPETPIVGSWDRRRLHIALRNLLSNALKFGAGRPVEVALAVEGPLARVSVRDHGPGLAPTDRGRLFERFARPASLRHYGGFGLGLWVVRQVAEEHGGRVDVWSEPGQGARFGFSLPMPA